MEALRAPKGVPDYFPPRSEAFRRVQQDLGWPAQMAGYAYVELPVFEDTSLFVRGVGESTDVVSKEMYTFTDRGDRSISLRPEGTAGVMRMVVEHGLDRGTLPVKVWYQGAFFRAERPQQGRYRQLQQVGIEAIGTDDPALDAEVVSLGVEAFRRVGLEQFELHLTSLGCAICRAPYRDRLQAFLATCDLDEQTRERAQFNPLRVLDDKRPEVQRQLADAPLIADALCAACAEHFALVCQDLRALGVTWIDAPRMVRGLDYYTRTTFEFVHPGLGAQSGIGGGGRYDGLMASIGGADLSGIGFGLGVDRTLLAAEAEGINLLPGSLVDVCGIALEPEQKTALLGICRNLRAAGIRADMVFGDRSVKSAMRAANHSGAPLVLILGAEEAQQGVVQLKDMQSGEQIAVSLGDVVSTVQARKGNVT